MDLRIKHIFAEEMKGDTSFQESRPTSLLARLFGRVHTSADMRKTWEQGVELGIEVGLRRAGPSGQIMELRNNSKCPLEQEFIQKLNSLCLDYKMGVEYHPTIGMNVVNKRFYLK